MKRLLVLVLALCLMLCACGEKDSASSHDNAAAAPGEGTVFPETVWESSVYRVENTSQSVFERPVAATFRLNLDIVNYLNTYGTLVDMSELGLEEKYDNAFFENHCLVAILVDTPGAACEPSVDKVESMGIMTEINLSITDGESDEISATWLIIIETEASVYDSDVNVYLY